MIGTKLGGEIIEKMSLKLATPSKNGLEFIAWDLTHFREGVANFKLIFWVNIPSILKGLVPIMKHLQNTPTFSISDGFYGRYGH